MKKVIINLSNKTFYTLVVIGLVVLLGVGVYSLTPGIAPNPGHVISEIAPPIGCADGQVLQFVDETTGWACTSAGGVDTNAETICDAGEVLLGDGTCQSTSAFTGGCPTGYVFVIDPVSDTAICTLAEDWENSCYKDGWGSKGTAYGKFENGKYYVKVECQDSWYGFSCNTLTETGSEWVEGTATSCKDGAWNLRCRVDLNTATKSVTGKYEYWTGNYWDITECP